jgi:hypothetical protein
MRSCRQTANHRTGRGKDLKDEYGHDLKKLVNEAVNRGLSLPPGSKEMIPRWLDEGFGLSPILWAAALIARWP